MLWLIKVLSRKQNYTLSQKGKRYILERSVELVTIQTWKAEI